MHLPSAERWRGGWESYGSRDTDSYSSYQDATDILEWSFLLLCTSSGQCLRLKNFFGDFLSNDSCLAGWLSAGLLTLPSWMCISVLACFWLRSGYCWVLLGGGMALPWLLECKCGLLNCACMPTWKGIDCGHFVLSAGPGWAAFLRSLFLTCVLGWATWEILLRYLESQNVATAILHTVAYLMIHLVVVWQPPGLRLFIFLWSFNPFLWFLSPRWRCNKSQLL